MAKYNENFKMMVVREYLAGPLGFKNGKKVAFFPGRVNSTESRGINGESRGIIAILA